MATNPAAKVAPDRALAGRLGRALSNVTQEAMTSATTITAADVDAANRNLHRLSSRMRQWTRLVPDNFAQRYLREWVGQMDAIERLAPKAVDERAKSLLQLLIQIKFVAGRLRAGLWPRDSQ